MVNWLVKHPRNPWMRKHAGGQLVGIGTVVPNPGDALCKLGGSSWDAGSSNDRPRGVVAIPSHNVRLTVPWFGSRNCGRLQGQPLGLWFPLQRTKPGSF